MKRSFIRFCVPVAVLTLAASLFASVWFRGASGKEFSELNAPIVEHLHGLSITRGDYVLKRTIGGVDIFLKCSMNRDQFEELCQSYAVTPDEDWDFPMIMSSIIDKWKTSPAIDHPEGARGKYFGVDQCKRVGRLQVFYIESEQKAYMLSTCRGRY